MYIHAYSFVFYCNENENTYTDTHSSTHRNLLFFQINITQTSDGTTYTGSIICPSCLEICYVRMYILFIPNIYIVMD